MLKEFSVLLGLGGAGLFAYMIKVAMSPEDATQAAGNALASVSAGEGFTGTSFIPAPLPEEVLKPQNLEGTILGSDNVGLGDISFLWTSDELDFTQISLLWREREEPPEAKRKFPKPVFRHEEIEAFYVEFVETRPIVKGKRKDVIVTLLKMLDDEGVCPSVANKNSNPSEQELRIGNDLYYKLASVPLWKHTLRVARLYVSKFAEEAMLPDCLIAALGHDIGKIPSYHDQYYKAGDHCWISEQILNTIPEFRTLNNRDEINRIIRGHHLIKTDFQLTELLKLADHEARRDETSEIMLMEKQGIEIKPIEVEIPVPKIRDEDVIVSAPDKEKKPKAPRKTQEPGRAQPSTAAAADVDKDQQLDMGFTAAGKQEGIFGDGDGSGKPISKFVPKQVDLPDWYNTDDLIKEIGGMINRIYDAKGGKKTWKAYSGENAIVWANETAVWDALQNIGGANDADFLVTAGNEALRRNLVYSVVRKLGEERKVFTEMIGKTYYQMPVTILTGGGRSFSSFLIPFQQEVFGMTTEDLENRKKSVLHRMVASIKPKMTGADECPE